MSLDKIVIRGAKEHNLKSIDLDIPRDQMVVITGISGSGKSSLAFSTIYAEGQRRYVESLSSYARQFLGQMDKSDVEYIEGLSPSISIDQKTTSQNPRSTVGTVTEVYDYLRLLWSRTGTAICPVCGAIIEAQSVDQMVDIIMDMPERSRIKIRAPIVRGRKGQHKRLIENIKKEGYNRIVVDGDEYDLFEEVELDKNKVHDIDVVVDRLIVNLDIQSRLSSSIETALELAGGLVNIETEDELIPFNEHMACPYGHMQIEEMEPRAFSFNSPYGMCQACHGLGFHLQFDRDLIIPNKELSINEGAIEPYKNGKPGSYYYEMVKAVADKHGFSMDKPIGQAPAEMMEDLFEGTDYKISFNFDSHYQGKRSFSSNWEGIIPNLERRYNQTGSDSQRERIEEYMYEQTCQECEGRRLREEILAIKVGDLSISEATEMPITRALAWFKNLELSEDSMIIAAPILDEVISRLSFLVEVGLGYLNMARAAGTLSGGESQRIRLATQIGSQLLGVIYVLDEPSIGLHQRDNERLLGALRDLTNIGNSLIIVEHDEETMIAADQIIDIGPGAGIHGGEIVFQGTYDEILKAPGTVTGDYLSRRRHIPFKKEYREPTGWLEVKGARENNLKDIDVSFPLGVFTSVTGVSGSGKSSLVNNILNRALSKSLNRARIRPGDFDSIEGMDQLDKVVRIDQSPIGRTPRSNPATYTKVFDDIRDLFANTPAAKAKGFNKGRFSFNVKGGRCKHCNGDGTIKVSMHFLPDIYVKCEECGGTRYNRETLSVEYKGKNIADVLAMSVEEGVDFFKNHPSIYRKLKTIEDVGLGYITLGQSSVQLSGGEAQRVKLATELSKRSTGRTIYILDEPTTGLHMADIDKLVAVLDRLVEEGNTVVVIEHNMDVIKSSDYLIDLGPEGGDAGGELIATGTPLDLAQVKESYTGQFLQAEFERDKKLTGEI